MNNLEKVRAIGRLSRLNNLEAVKLSQIKYRSSPKYKEWLVLNRERLNVKKRAYMKTQSGKQMLKVKYIKHKALYKEKLLARDAINKGVVRGTVIKPQICEYPLCDSKILEGHHFNYSKRLLVTWLCKKHHRIADKVREAFYKYNLIKI
jgi:hypothetical protein